MILKMTVLVSCHLSSDGKKKRRKLHQKHLFSAHFFLDSYILSISGFFRLICLEPISFRLICFESFSSLSPSVLGLFLQMLPAITNQQIKCRWQDDNKESFTKNMDNFYFVVIQSRQTIPHGFTWVLKSFFNRTFWPLPCQFVYKGPLQNP